MKEDWTNWTSAQRGAFRVVLGFAGLGPEPNTECWLMSSLELEGEVLVGEGEKIGEGVRGRGFVGDFEGGDELGFGAGSH